MNKAAIILNVSQPPYARNRDQGGPTGLETRQPLVVLEQAGDRNEAATAEVNPLRIWTGAIIPITKANPRHIAQYLHNVIEYTCANSKIEIATGTHN